MALSVKVATDLHYCAKMIKKQGSGALKAGTNKSVLDRWKMKLVSCLNK